MIVIDYDPPECEECGDKGIVADPDSPDGLTYCRCVDEYYEMVDK